MGGLSTAAVPRTLATIAGKRHGVVTRTQLLRAGITERQIDARLTAGSLIRVHRGVYRVGHIAPSTEALYMAAVLACGPGALLCGRAAGHLLGILKGRPPAPEVATRGKRRVKGLRTRRSRLRGRTLWRGIPVTSAPRTLVELAVDLTDEELARACHEAGVRHHTTPAQVEAVLAQRPNMPGAARLRSVLLGEVRVVQSRLEGRFLEHLRAMRRVLPETNRPAGTHRVDCRWPDLHLTVELDSYRYHRSRYAWEQDRKREREARARGDDFRRYTWGDVFDDPDPMLAELVELLPEL